RALLAQEQSAADNPRATVVESRENIQHVLAQAETMVERELPLPPDGAPSRPVAPTIAERAIPSTQAAPSVAPQRQPQPPGAQVPQGPQPIKTGPPTGLVIAIAVVVILLLAAIAFVMAMLLG